MSTRSSSCLAAPHFPASTFRPALSGQHFPASTFRPAHSSSRQPHTRPGQKYAREKQEFLSAFFVSAPVNDNHPARGGFETLCVSDSVVKSPPSGAGRRCGLGNRLSGYIFSIMEEHTDQTPDDPPAVIETLNFFRERFGTSLTPDSRMNLDSMDWIELATRLGNCTGVRVDDDDIARIGTVRDLLAAVARRDGTVAADAAAPLAHPER